MRKAKKATVPTRLRHRDAKLSKPFNFSVKPLIHNAAITAGILSRKLITGPYSVHVSIADACNYRCIMCWEHSSQLEGQGADDIARRYHADKKFKSNFMDLELYKSLIDSLSKHGTQYIGIAGIGEPLLHKNIAEAVDYARKKNIKVWLTTNGSRLEPGLMKDLIRAGLNDLCVSLNAGTKEEYALVHSNQENSMFDNIVENLEWLREYKTRSASALPRLTLSNVISNVNSHRVVEMMRVGIQVGAARVAYKPIDYFSQTRRFGLEEQDYIDLHRRLAKAGELAAQHQISTSTKQFQQMIDLRDSKRLPAPCFAGWLYPLVLANGDVTFCCVSREVLGSLMENSFEDIWFGAKHRRLNNAAIKIHKTQQPVSKSRCFGCEQMMANLRIYRYLWPVWGKARGPTPSPPETSGAL